MLSLDNRSLFSLPSELPSICFSSPCFLLLVPHLLTLLSHSLHHNPPLAFLPSVALRITVFCASPRFMCRHDCSTPRNGISGAVLRYSLSHLKGSSATDTPLLQYLWTFTTVAQAKTPEGALIVCCFLKKKKKKNQAQWMSHLYKRRKTHFLCCCHSPFQTLSCRLAITIVNETEMAGKCSKAVHNAFNQVFAVTWKSSSKYHHCNI